MAFIVGSRSALGNDRVAQNADAAVDLDLDDIARFQSQRWLAREADPRPVCPSKSRRRQRAASSEPSLETGVSKYMAQPI
jgi:hypothetical protein